MTLNLEAIKARCEKATAKHTCTETPYGCLRCESEIDSLDAECLLLVAEVERLRKVEAAAEALLGPWDDEWDCSGSPGHPQLTKAVVALRAALDAAQGGG